MNLQWRDLEARVLYGLIIFGLAGLFYIAAVRDRTVIESQPRTLTTEQAIECVAEHWAAGMHHNAAVTTCAALASMAPSTLEVVLP